MKKHRSDAIQATTQDLIAVHLVESITRWNVRCSDVCAGCAPPGIRRDQQRL